MFSKTLRKLRIGQNMTQNEMAKALNISRVAYTNYELGKREPDFNTVTRIAIILGTSVDYLLGNPLAQETRVTEHEFNKDNKIASTLRVLMLQAAELSSESRDDLKKYIEMLKLRDEAVRKNLLHENTVAKDTSQHSSGKEA